MSSGASSPSPSEEEKTTAVRSQCRKTQPQSAYECGIYTRTQTWFILHSSLNVSSKQDCASPVYRGLMSARFMFDSQLGNTRARQGAPGNIKVHAPARTRRSTPCTPLTTIVQTEQEQMEQMASDLAHVKNSKESS